MNRFNLIVSRNIILMIVKLLTYFTLLCLVLSSQDVPIQKNYYGFSVGDPYGTLHIEFFLDFQCPDSKASFQAWTNVRKSLSLVQNKIKLSFNFSPLPYHFYATLIHEGFFYILKKLGTTSAQDYMSYVFSHQDDYIEQNNLNKSGKDFREQFSSTISKQFKVDAAELAKELVIGSDSFKSLKDHFRYTAIVNGVSGTPMFKANGVFIDGAQDFTYLDWINFIKQYKS